VTRLEKGFAEQKCYLKSQFLQLTPEPHDSRLLVFSNPSEEGLTVLKTTILATHYFLLKDTYILQSRIKHLVRLIVSYILTNKVQAESAARSN
jgi:hypothetical protein